MTSLSLFCSFSILRNVRLLTCLTVRIAGLTSLSSEINVMIYLLIGICCYHNRIGSVFRRFIILRNVRLLTCLTVRIEKGQNSLMRSIS